MNKNYKLAEFVEDFSNTIDYYLKKYNLNKDILFGSAHKNNKKFTEQIIKFLASHFKNPYFLEKTIISTEKLDEACTYLHDDTASIIDMFINEFLFKDNYFSIGEGKVLDKTADFKIDKSISTREISNLYQRNHLKNFPILILENGECYFSPTVHAMLIRWLNANSIDVTNALRIEQLKHNNELSMSSMYLYKWLLQDKSNEHIQLTKNQADTFYQIYCKLNSIKKLEPLEESLANSFKLGIREHTDVGDKNLTILVDAFGNNLDLYELKRNVYQHQKDQFMW